MGKIKRYEAEGLQVTYDPDRCIHAAECVRGLPTVFAPGRRPWVEPGAAPAEEVAAVVRRCPTGALQYRLAGGPPEEAASPNTLKLVPDGPIYASGNLVILDAERREIGRTTRAAFCRCGASAHKPFCDGRHSEVGFADSADICPSKVRPVEDGASGELSIRLRADGPLVLEGSFRITGRGGAEIEGGAAALCRCGASSKKPFCDATHRDIEFQADDPTAEDAG